jgi:formamidopyrimidine-DNA glycosylase
VPEVLEIEIYRGWLTPIVGRRISAVHAPDPWFLKGGLDARTVASALTGGCVAGLRRRGKLLLVDVVGGGRRDHAAKGRRADEDGLGEGPAEDVDVVLGLRFGMTGRPILDDGTAPMELEYGSNRDEPAWNRFVLDFERDGRLRINDPRRLGGVELDPDEERLGPDVLSLGLRELRDALRSTAPVKSVLLDQHRIAGLGNMLADECLWQAGIDPARPARSLDDAEVRRLHRTIRRVLPRMLAAGGSHTGRLEPAVRRSGAVCPKDGAPLVKRMIGGRATYSCSEHQR